MEGHQYHQRIAKNLQELADPSTVPYVKKILEDGFEVFSYTASEDRVIAKWFSWLLYEIGTEDAFSLMREYAVSKNVEIANEMAYRLDRANI